MSDWKISEDATTERLRITPSYTTTFIGDDGVFLTISPEGFSDGVTTIEIGDAARLFAEWCRTWIPAAIGAEHLALVDRQQAEIEKLKREVASLRAHQYVRPITFGPTHRSDCLHENSPTGKITGLACPCPKCTIQYGVES